MGIIQAVRRYYVNSIRLLKITKKPTRREISITSRITAIGVVVIGTIGFLLQTMVSFIVE